MSQAQEIGKTLSRYTCGTSHSSSFLQASFVFLRCAESTTTFTAAKIEDAEVFGNGS